VLDGLHRVGITIAIDDFGSGNCSLNHLRHLPIGEVKLDRSLSASITEQRRVAAVVRAVIDLSRTPQILDLVAADATERCERAGVSR
jgi:predicted signal transduction protein with EAL and GGDEF domain